MIGQARRFHVGSAVNADRYVYVERETDSEALRLLRDGQHVNLRAGRQAGKTSLMLRLSKTLEAEGHRCLHAELSLFFDDVTFDEGLTRLTRELLDQEGENGESPVAGIYPSDRLRRLLNRLTNTAPTGGRLYLMLDELDILLDFPARDRAAFFSALSNACRQNDSRLTLLLVSVLSPTEMLMGYQTGSANIDLQYDLPLRPFENNTDVRKQLAQQGFPEETTDSIDPLLTQVLELSGGQPFLTSLICDQLQVAKDRPRCFQSYSNKLLSEQEGPASQHVNQLFKLFLSLEYRLFSVAQTYREILDGQQPQNAWNIAYLLDIGIIARAETGYRISNPIYRRRLNNAWLEQLKDHQQTRLQQKRLLHKPRGDRLFRRKIALLFCGGTIGMVQDQGKANLDGQGLVLGKFAEQELNKIAEIYPVFHDPRDGINMTPDRWLDIASFVNNGYKDYDGFVVAHGTDTLAFTASAVAFILGGALDRPVVFTGAQTTIDVPHGDARDNLIRACYVAAHDQAISEVQISFGDQVLRAVRAVKTDDRTYDGFASPGWPPLARVTERLLVNDHALGPKSKCLTDYQPHLADRVFYITLVPGLRAEHFRAVLKSSSDSLDGVVISTPGVGNIPSIAPYSFRPFIEEAVNKCIPVLITSQVPINPYTQAQYEMASVPAELGAIPAGNLTIAAAYTKFAWVIGCVRAEYSKTPLKKESYLAEIKHRMRLNYIGEQSESVAPPE